MKRLINEKKGFKLILKCSAYFVLIIALPAMLKSDFIVPNKLDALRVEMENKDPSYLFIGNSMLKSRIDNDYFEELTGEKSMVMIEPGVTSAFWYLAIKNIVSVSDKKPSKVFIFFRNTYLTEPKFRTGNQYKSFLQEYRSSDEPVLESILNVNLSLDERFSRILSDIYPLQQLCCRRVTNKISQGIIYAINFIQGSNISPSQKFTELPVNNIFAPGNTRVSGTDGENVNRNRYKWNYNFSDAVRGSFLPHILEIAWENDLALVFIRVQKRPVHGRTYGSDIELTEYINELKKYIESHDFQFYDFTGDPRVSIDLYGGGDHIHAFRRQQYTKIFYEAVKEESK